MGQVWAIAKKDVTLLLRDKAGFFWVLGMPLMIAFFFGAVFGGSGGPTAAMEIAVVDKDQSPRSMAFIDELKKSGSVKVSAQTRTEAQNDVRLGNKVAYLTIPKGFGETSFFVPEQGATIELGLDPKRTAEAGYLDGLIAQAWFKQMQKTMSDPNQMKEQTRVARDALSQATNMDPARKRAIEGLMADLDKTDLFGGGGSAGQGGFQGPSLKKVDVTQQGSTPHSSFDITFPQGILWGLIGVVTAFAQAIVKERTMGTMQRLKVAPLTRAKLLAGKALACFLTAVGVILTLLLIASIVGVHAFQNPAVLAMAIVSAATAFVGLMVLLSVLGKTEQAVAGAGWGVMLTFSMIGGGMVPLIAMPQWMLQASQISPVRWAITALEGAIWRGYSTSEMLVPCGVLVAMGLLFFTLGAMILRRIDP